MLYAQIWMQRGRERKGKEKRKRKGKGKGKGKRKGKGKGKGKRKGKGEVRGYRAGVEAFGGRLLGRASVCEGGGREGFKDDVQGCKGAF